MEPEAPDRLANLCDTIPQLLQLVDEKEFSLKPTPGKRAHGTSPTAGYCLLEEKKAVTPSIITFYACYMQAHSGHRQHKFGLDLN